MRAQEPDCFRLRPAGQAKWLIESVVTRPTRIRHMSMP